MKSLSMILLAAALPTLGHAATYNCVTAVSQPADSAPVVQRTKVQIGEAGGDDNRFVFRRADGAGQMNLYLLRPTDPREVSVQLQRDPNGLNNLSHTGSGSDDSIGVLPLARKLSLSRIVDDILVQLSCTAQ